MSMNDTVIDLSFATFLPFFGDFSISFSSPAQEVQLLYRQ